MKFLEKDLEQIIFETRNELLQKKGLNITGKKIRQLRIGNYGIADLVTITKPDFIKSKDLLHKGFFNDNININIYELKQDKISASAFLQACGYYKGIYQYLSKYDKLSFGYNINLNIIGRTIDKDSSLIYIPDIFENVSFYTYDYGFEGITFKNEELYCLTNQGF